MVDPNNETPALDDLYGDEADLAVGEYVASEADVHPEGIVAHPDDFEFPKVDKDE